MDHTANEPSLEAVPLCQVEEMLDQLEYEEAAAAYMAGCLRIGHLLWS